MAFDDLHKKATTDWRKIEDGNDIRIFIGTATCGRAAGSLEVMQAVTDELKRNKIKARIIEIGCIGTCYAEPMMDIALPGEPRISYSEITPELAREIVRDYILNNDPRTDLAMGTIGNGRIQGIPDFYQTPMLKEQKRILLKKCGIIDPKNIMHYIAQDGYSGLVRALKMQPEEIIGEIKKSGLRGRGGAGFPTGMKWEFCRKASGDKKYIICNADEGDPGAFMNRSLLEGDPHAVLEGMVIGAFAIGASEGYIYVRAEYPLAIECLKTAIQQATDNGLIGNDILGSGFNFHLHIKEGAGAFVCGEETAMMASIEGKRGMPRSRPPFPANSGLWGKPTNINNTETWANVSQVLLHGHEWYGTYGSEKSKGTKTFALTGKINRTGLIEVPIGMPLKKIINEIGGGIPRGKKLKAVQTGGPSGGCIPAELLDLETDYESLNKAGSIMGSGGMVVMDEDTCMVDMARFFLSFTQTESCGKCVMCRLGTKQMLNILEAITTGKGKDEDIDLLLQLCDTIKCGSLCALGQTAPNPILTTLRYFRSEYEEHIKDHHCRAGVCKMKKRAGIRS